MRLFNSINYFTQKAINNRFRLIYLFLISLSIRICYIAIVYFGGTNEKWIDDWEYLRYANEIIKQGIFVPDISHLNSSVGPVFPIIVSGFIYLFGSNYLILFIFNGVLSALLTPLIYLTGKEIFNPKVGLWAAIWSIFYFEYIRYVPHILKESLLFLSFALTIYLFIKYSKNYLLYKYLILFSLSFSFLIHLDERFFTYFPVFFFAIMYFNKKEYAGKLKHSLMFAGITVLLMVPWLVRNYLVYERPVILTERTAVYTDKILGYDKSDEKKAVNMDLVVDSLKKGFNVSSINELKKQWILKGLKNGIIPYKFGTFERIYVETINFWTPVRFWPAFVNDGYRYIEWSTAHNFVLIMQYGILLPFMALGIYYSFRQKNKIAIFVAYILVTHTVIHVILSWVVYRYRLPIELYVLVFSFFGLNQTFNKKYNNGS